jgi:hypothetical protein
VTINIYFPAEKVENVAEDIVDDIRGTDNKKNPQSQKGTKPLSRLMEIFGFLGPASAHAQDVTEVSNATIRALKENMRQRYPQIKPLYVKGLIKEGDNGYLVEGNLRQVDLKTRRQVKKLMDAENSDRTKLYKEVAVALKIDPSQINRVEEIFAKQWQKSVP